MATAMPTDSPAILIKECARLLWSLRMASLRKSRNMGWLFPWTHQEESIFFLGCDSQAVRVLGEGVTISNADG
jgi:hypothetical protein